MTNEQRFSELQKIAYSETEYHRDGETRRILLSLKGVKLASLLIVESKSRNTKEKYYYFA